MKRNFAVVCVLWCAPRMSKVVAPPPVHPRRVSSCWIDARARCPAAQVVMGIRAERELPRQGARAGEEVTREGAGRARPAL